MSTILIAFASIGEETDSLVEMVADELRQTDHAVTVGRCEDAPDAGAFDAVLIGSDLSGRDWLPAAKSYLDRNAEVLAERPTFLFQRVAGRSRSLPGSVEDRAPGAVHRWCHRSGLGEVQRFGPGDAPAVRTWAYLVGITLLEQVDLGWR